MNDLSSFDIFRLVTLRELRQRGSSKAFLFGGAVTLLLLTAAILLPQVLGSGPATWRAGYIGQEGEQILQATSAVAAAASGEDDKVALETMAYDDEAAAQTALRNGDIELVVDGDRILREGSTGFGGSDLQDAVQRAAAIVQLGDQLPEDSIGQVVSALDGEPLTVSTLQGEADTQLEQARSVIAYAGLMLLYFAILAFGGWTLQGIAEEKSTRVVEVLLSTVKPWQLMAGKILGIGLLGLAQFAITVVWGLTLVRVTGVLPLPAVPVDSALTLILWFVLGFGLYSVIYAAVGALVSRMEDAQSVAFPVSMLAIVGFFVSFQVLDDPTGLLARIFSFVPFTAPFVVPIRVAYQAISAWEHLLAVLVMMAAIAALVRVAGRIYARGLLHFGGKLGLRQAWRTAEVR